MTDIEALKDAVIEAARNIRGEFCGLPKYKAVDDALAALDVALVPDPWQLLRSTSHYKDVQLGPIYADIIAALDWKAKHG